MLSQLCTFVTAASSGQALMLSGTGVAPHDGSRSTPVLGVALQDVSALGTGEVQPGGLLDHDVAQLGNGKACAVGVDAAGSLVRATDPALSSALNWAGRCNDLGTIVIDPRREPFSRPDDFGALGDGVSDDTTAIQLAVDAVAASNGYGVEQPLGVVQFSSGKYRCHGPLVWDTKAHAVIRGPAQIVCALQDATDFIQLLGCYQFVFEDLVITYDSPTYTGALCFASRTGELGNDVAAIRWERCSFYGEVHRAWCCAPQYNARACIALDGVDSSAIRDCSFSYAKVGVKGCDPAWVNQLLIEGCSFIHLVEASIRDPGEAWCVTANTFEPLEYIVVDKQTKLPVAYPCADPCPHADLDVVYELLNPAINAVDQDLGYFCRGFSFVGNWVGDGGPVEGAWLTLKGFGITISGNMISRDDSPGHAIKIVSSNGVQITGNHLVGSLTFATKATAQDADHKYNYGVLVAANFHQTGVVPDWAAVTTRAVIASGDNATFAPAIDNGPLQIGGVPGTINELVVGQVKWTFGALASGVALSSEEIALTGMHSQAAALCAGATPALPEGVLLHADLVNDGAMRLTLHNASGQNAWIDERTFTIWAVR